MYIPKFDTFNLYMSVLQLFAHKTIVVLQNGVYFLTCFN